MKKNKLDAIGYVDDQLVEKADKYTSAKKKKSWTKGVSMAACLCLIIGAILTIPIMKNIGGITADTESDTEQAPLVVANGNKDIINEGNKGSDTIGSIDEGNKGGDTSEATQDLRIGSDGGYYEVFKPGVDEFEPLEDMTLENRFCAFDYNGYSYYPALNGELTAKDYEQDSLSSVKAAYWELRSANSKDEVSGIVYYAKIDIYKLKGVEPSDAVACVISFNGEIKIYKYNAAEVIEPSFP